MQLVNDLKRSSLATLFSGSQKTQFVYYTQKEAGLLKECYGGSM